MRAPSTSVLPFLPPCVPRFFLNCCCVSQDRVVPGVECKHHVTHLERYRVDMAVAVLNPCCVLGIPSLASWSLGNGQKCV